MTVPPPGDDDLADVPEGADLDEAFWRDYAVVVLDYREEWVDEVLDARGPAGLAEEIASDRDAAE